jgi:predicted metal-dependent hydrolase
MNEPRFPYTVRLSPKGRNIHLRVTFKHGLVVVVPRGYDTGKIPEILERKKHWIRAAIDRAEAQRKFVQAEPSWSLPLQIQLPAVGVTWHVSGKQTGAPWAAVRELGANRLLIFGAIHDQSACRAALARWLMRQTRESLVPRLQTLSLKTGLRYNRIFVKRPRTRWASCSRRRSVSLNAKLLFLPPDLVDYVIIHELCHLEEMNHSRRFWALVAHHSPDFRDLDRRLREMWKAVPRWAY